MSGVAEFDFEQWRTGKVYYTADLHLEHERIIEFCDRPVGSVAEMNEVIIGRINAVVGTRDTLVILGDVLLGKMETSLPLLGKIKAKRIWLIPGNHDRFSLAYGHSGSPEVRISKRRMWAREYEEAGSAPGGAGRGGGSGGAGKGRELRCEPDRQPSAWRTTIGGRAVMLSHYPYQGDSREGEGIADRHRELRPVWGGLPLIHGHVHGRWRVRGPMFNVGVDVNGFRPVGEDVLAKWLSGVPVGGPRLAAMQAAATAAAGSGSGRAR